MPIADDNRVPPPPPAPAPAPKRRIRLAIDPEESTTPTFEVEYPADARKLDIIQKNPLVPAGALLTAAILAGGLLAFKGGSQVWSQRLMRGRVLAQGATLGVLAYSVYDTTSKQSKSTEALAEAEADNQGMTD